MDRISLLQSMCHYKKRNTVSPFLGKIRCCHVYIGYVPSGLAKKKAPASDPVSAYVRVPFVFNLIMTPCALPPTNAGLVSKRI